MKSWAYGTSTVTDQPRDEDWRFPSCHYPFDETSDVSYQQRNNDDTEYRPVEDMDALVGGACIDLLGEKNAMALNKV